MADINIQTQSLPRVVSQFRRDLIDSHPTISRLRTIDDLLEYKFELGSVNNNIEQFWALSVYCNRIRILGLAALTNTTWTVANRWLGMPMLDQLDKIRRQLKLFRLQYYNEISQYEGSGMARKWNLPVHVFMAEAVLLLLRHMLLIRWRQTGLISLPNANNPNTIDYYTEQLTNDDVETLCNQDMVVAYGSELRASDRVATSAGVALTQFEFIISMRTLADVWYKTPFSYALMHYVHWLMFEFIFLALLSHEQPPTRYDGDGVRDWYTTGAYRSATDEFIAHAAVQFTYMERDLLAVRALVRRMAERIPNYELMWKRNIESQALDVRIRFFEWIKPLLSDTLRARNANTLREFIAPMLLRPGEIELFARYNNGIVSQDFIAVAECGRSPVQVTWWTQHAFSDMMSYFDTKSVPTMETKNRFRDLMIFALFSQFIQTRFGLDWWNFVCVHEHDFMDAYERKLLQSNNPLIVLSGGSFALYHRKIVHTSNNTTGANNSNNSNIVTYDVTIKVYKHADEVIVAWVGLQKEKHKMVFNTIRSGSFNLLELEREYGRWCNIATDTNDADLDDY